MVFLTRASARFGSQLVPRRQVRGLAHAAAQGKQVAVVGGGLTGLTTAYYLAKQLPSTAHITLYESSDRLGGWIRTDKVPVNVNGVQGVVNFERGPRTLTSLRGNCWRFDDLILYDLAIDLGLKLVYPKDLPRYVYYPDHLVKMPPNASFFECLSEDLFRECAFDMLGAAATYLTGRSRQGMPAQDLSIAEWARHITFGNTMGSNLASAMIHGIYGGDIDRLSARSVLDRMYYHWHVPVPPKGTVYVPPNEFKLMERLGSDQLICWEANKPKGSLVHFGAHGLESLPKALEDALTGQSNVTIRRRAPVTNISHERKDSKVQVTSNGATQLYDQVVSTSSSKQLVQSTGNVVSSLGAIESVSIMTVNLWYPMENMKPPGFGYLIPRSVPAEQNPENALGVFFDSDVIAERGPDEPAGTKLFVLMGGHYYKGRRPPSEEEAIAQAKAVLERHVGIPRDTPCHAMARLAEDCIPQHNVGHHDLLVAADEQLASGFDGQLIAANGSYGRVGAMGALRNGYEAAKSVTSDEGWSGLDPSILNRAIGNVPRTAIPCRDAPSNA